MKELMANCKRPIMITVFTKVRPFMPILAPGLLNSPGYKYPQALDKRPPLSQLETTITFFHAKLYEVYRPFYKASNSCGLAS